MERPPLLPKEFWEAEARQVRERRGAAPGRPGRPAPADTSGPPVPPARLLGLAFSGGGIRSATLSLGVMQALAKLDRLKFVDYLSTVSGGGYAGTFLGGLHQRWGVKPGAPAAPRSDDWARVRAALTERRGHPVDWLRENGRYLAPNGAGDLSVAAAVVVRNLAAVHVVLFTTFLALYLSINGLRRLLTLAWEQSPRLANRLEQLLDRPNVWWSPLLLLAAVSFLVWVVPLGAAYWLVPGDGEGRGRPGGAPRGGAVRRNELTLKLRTALVATVALALLGLLDSLGQTVYLAVAGGTLLKGLGALGAALASLAVAGQRVAGALGARSGKPPSIPVALVAALLALLLVTALLGGTSALAHWLTWTAPSRGVRLEELDEARYFIALAGAWGLAWLFGGTWAFINGSSLAALYGARLARAYLGASNVERTEPGRQALAVQLPGDDLPLTGYQPHAHGGPLHLVNVTINETTGGRSQVEQRDRKGLGMAIGPAGVSVGIRHHAAWVTEQASGERTGALRGTVEPVGGFRVFPAEASIQPRWPTVGRWMAISGAAVSTGLGSRTSLSLSLLIGLLNFRLGQWWRSGVDPASRDFASRSPSRLGRLLGRLALRFPVQAHLLNELLARFPGTSSPDWYLTDGGHSENSAAWELVRRRLPTIVVCDHGADPDQSFEDLGILVRKARTDLGADIRFLDAEELAALPGGAGRALGTLADLGFGEAVLREPVAGEPAPAPGRRRPTRYAALARIRYERSEETSTLLWLRPAVLGDEPADLLGYHALHPDFPQQSTADQFFDEAQWESYRRLGEQLGEAVFSTLPPPPGAQDPADGWAPFG